MRFDVVTIFPQMFAPFFREGVVGRAAARGLISVEAHDLRQYTTGRHRQVDDLPFGGGPGMVMKPEPFFAAVAAVRALNPGPVLLMEPWGEPFTQSLARELAAEPGVVILCGRYEGVDDRVRSGVAAREVSIGDYVLSGGELPALVVIDAVARLLPGVVGDAGSLTQDSFQQVQAAPDDTPAGYPQFTRPAVFQGMSVPDVLLSGNHSRIREWRRQEADRRAAARENRTRPEMRGER
jgi:tRNA (guanine37-N1)-methyltransferase